MSSRIGRCIVALLVWGAWSWCGVASAQFGETSGKGPRFDRESTQQIQIGLTVTAEGGPCRGIVGTAPVPIDWPEQKVQIVSEDISANVTDVSYRTQGDVKQMIVTMPFIAAGEEARAVVTFEVTRRTLLPPEKTDLYVIAEKPDRAVKPFLGPSPYIESRHGKIKALAKEALEGKEGGWVRVEALYDKAREKVEYRNGKLKGAVAALRDGYGDCEELSSLFIAMCRASNIPARTVWVPGHCYAEFHLEDDEGVGHWFPCQAAGLKEFGGISELRPILQKGDSFKVPEKKERQRYIAETLTGAGGKPKVKFIRQIVAVN